MSKNIRITADAATVTTKGQDLIVSPKRLSMFLTVIVIGLAGIGLLFLGEWVLIGYLAKGDLEPIGSIIPMMSLGAGLASVAYFAFNKGRSQKAIHFEAIKRLGELQVDEAFQPIVEGLKSGYYRVKSAAVDTLVIKQLRH